MTCTYAAYSLCLTLKWTRYCYSLRFGLCVSVSHLHFSFCLGWQDGSSWGSSMVSSGASRSTRVNWKWSRKLLQRSAATTHKENGLCCHNIIYYTYLWEQNAAFDKRYTNKFHKLLRKYANRAFMCFMYTVLLSFMCLWMFLSVQTLINTFPMDT